MEREKVINSLRTLRDKGECISQTIVLDEAIKLLQASPVIKVFCTDGGVLEATRLDINGNSIIADEYREVKDYEVDYIEVGEV